MKKLSQNFIQHPFSYKEAVESGFTKYQLNKFIQEGIIERIDKGIYIPTSYNDTELESQFHLASLQCGKPSCICLLSALDFYHITDQVPNKIWILVPQEKRVKNEKLQLIRSRNPHWEIGIKKTENYWITDLPRTLVECLLYKNRIGSDVAIGSLKMALRNKKVKLKEVLQVAIQMNVKDRIYPYIETLAL